MVSLLVLIMIIQALGYRALANGLWSVGLIVGFLAAVVGFIFWIVRLATS